MQPITVLIVGQIRNQHVLLYSLGNLVGLRKQGLVDRVILATWTGELAKINHLLPTLFAAGVEVTCAEEPHEQWFVPGHLMNQMRGVDLALEGVEDTAWVLRGRPDVPIDVEMITGLAAADMTLDPGIASPALGHKVWSPYVELCQPMCISDLTFFGQYADILKLQNFDLFHEIARTHLAIGTGGRPITSYDAEVRRFAPAFFAAYPVLAEYYRLYNRFFLGVFEVRRAMLTMLFEQDIYWQYVAAYLDILQKYFLIGRDTVPTRVSLVRPQDFDQTEDLGTLDMTGSTYASRVLAERPDLAQTTELFTAGAIYCNSSPEIRAVADHLRAVGVPLGQRLNEAMAYRKDAARIAALRGFREKLETTLASGFEMGRVKGPAWQYPFPTHFLNLPKLEAAG